MSAVKRAVDLVVFSPTKLCFVFPFAMIYSTGFYALIVFLDNGITVKLISILSLFVMVKLFPDASLVSNTIAECGKHSNTEQRDAVAYPMTISIIALLPLLPP